MKLGLIMLAAGNSRRFGSNKLLYGIDGMPMYRHILLELKKVKAALEEQGHRCEIIVVTQYEEIAQEAEKLGVRFLYNLHPDEGISSSLKIGLRVNREMKLSGDVGGKRVGVAHREDVAVMKVEDGREMVDVDFSDGRR